METQSEPEPEPEQELEQELESPVEHRAGEGEQMDEATGVASSEAAGRQVDGAAGTPLELRGRLTEEHDCCAALCCTMLLAMVPTVLLAGEIRSAPTCLDIGESQRLRLHVGQPLQCCPGLTEVGPIQPGCGGGADGCGVCAGWRPLDEGVIGCIRCGDGICGVNEDWCTCRKDCEPPEPLDLSRDINDHCDWFNCTGQQDNNLLRRVCLGGRCEQGCDSSRCWRCFTHDSCDAADGCQWDQSHWLKYQAAGIVNLVESDGSTAPTVDERFARLPLGMTTIAGACAPVSLSTKQKTLNTQIVQVITTVTVALAMLVALCEVSSWCAGKLVSKKATAEHDVDDARRPGEEQPEDCDEVDDLGSEGVPVLGDGSSRSSIDPTGSDDEAVASGVTQSSRRAEHENNSWWYAQVLRVALFCNVFNMLIAFGLPFFGWWGLSSSMSCLELRHSVCEREDCLEISCSDDAPWPQIFWGCLIATPFCLLSTSVFLHAACTGRIDSHDCIDSHGRAGSDGWDDDDDVLLYQSHLGWEPGFGSSWDHHHALSGRPVYSQHNFHRPANGRNLREQNRGEVSSGEAEGDTDEQRPRTRVAGGYSIVP